MKNKAILEGIRQNIASQELSYPIKNLLEILGNDKNKNAVILLQARYIDNKKKHDLNLLGYDEFSRNESQIRNSLLSIIDDIENLDSSKIIDNNSSDELNNEMNKNKANFIIVSSSPRRQKLLAQIGLKKGENLIIEDPKDHDSPKNSVSLEEAINLSIRNVKNKIRKIEIEKLVDEHEWVASNTLTISFQTYVYFNNKVLDKPLLRRLADAEDLEQARKNAFEILDGIKGKNIKIITAIGAVLDRIKNESDFKTMYVVSDAYLKNYSEQDIHDYISTDEPLDKAGAFGIQEKGVFLFEKVFGSYTNIVGLPLREFIDFLDENFGEKILIPKYINSEDQMRHTDYVDRVWPTIVSAGDVNCDYIHFYDGKPDDFFSHHAHRNKKIQGKIIRAAGGTAVHFAKSSAKVGFKECLIVGTYGRDTDGQFILKNLNDYKETRDNTHDIYEQSTLGNSDSYKYSLNDKEKNIVKFAVLEDEGRPTGISLMFLSKDDNFALTVSYSEHSWPLGFIEPVESVIKRTDVLYVSGYCMIDDKRSKSTQKMIEWAKKRKPEALVVSDAVKGMDKIMTFDSLIRLFQYEDDYRKTPNNGIDIFVIEFPELFSWMEIPIDKSSELSIWEQHKSEIIEKLRIFFKVIILRTSNYSHEIIVTPFDIEGPIQLDYSLKEPIDRIGYSARRTSKILYNYLSPRIILASQSPQRLELLSQIISPMKILVQVSKISEQSNYREAPQEKVMRLSKSKAFDIYNKKAFAEHIEFIIGADTEMALKSDDGTWEIIGDPHPKDEKEAIDCLRKINGKKHYAISGVTVLGRNPLNGEFLEVTKYAETIVQMANLSDQEIVRYVQTGEPIGRAGGYAIQGMGTLLIQDIDGSYSNIVGLPLELLTDILRENFGKKVSDFDKISGWQMSKGLPNK